MFIAMNRFKVVKNAETEFEKVWASRDSHLREVPGFCEFQLLKCINQEDYSLYASHSIWTNHYAFVQWTKSKEFRAAHHGAGDNRVLYLGSPVFEGFEVISEIKR
jgi:heme-degrading monooxygenase HmoA